jgi:predicted component of type VI protein secretion system
MVRRLASGVLCLCALVLLDGCRHKQAPPTVPAVLQPPVVAPPTPEAPSMDSPPPASLSDAPPVKVTQIKPKRTPKRSSKTAAPVTEASAAQVDAGASAPLPEGSSVGELSAGGDSTPQTQQDATALIASCEKGLKDLPQSAAGQQGQIRKVQYFLRQAKQALKTGDAEGAKTLATKAKLLMDDLTK